MTDTAASGSPETFRSQTDVVVQDIKAMIIRGELRAGSRLPIESDLASALGVSRGSLREGVRALAMMGVLETRQGDGTYVTALDASMLLAPMGFVVDLQPTAHAEDITTVRRVLEVEAAARAALRISPAQLDEARGILDSVVDVVERPSTSDYERIMNVDIAFHRVLARASGNTVLEALIDALASRTVRTRMWRSVTERGAVASTHEQHEQILRAIAAGDPDRARLAMAVHLLGVEDFAATYGDPDPREEQGGPAESYEAQGSAQSASDSP